MVQKNAVQIDGLRELQAKLKTAPKGIRTLFNQEMKGVAASITADVRSQVPVKSGAARNSVKPSYANGWLAIRAGGASAPYYPWLEFGGKGYVGFKANGGRTTQKDGSRHKGRWMNPKKRRIIKDGRWLYPTIARRRKDIYAVAQDVVERWKRVNL